MTDETNQPTTAPAPSPAPAQTAEPRGRDALTEREKKYGIAYDAMLEVNRSPLMKGARIVSVIIIATVFVLLMWEAISYRMALSG